MCRWCWRGVCDVGRSVLIVEECVEERKVYTRGVERGY